MVIETDRLFLHKSKKEHTDEQSWLLNSERVALWLGGIRSLESILKNIENESKHWQKHKFGPWVAFDKNSNRLIGRGGIRYTSIDGVREVELFYALHPEFWGKGLATEFAYEAIDWAKKQRSVSSIIALTLPANKASQRVIQKVGFKYERELKHAGLDHAFYRLNL